MAYSFSDCLRESQGLYGLVGQSPNPFQRGSIDDQRRALGLMNAMAHEVYPGSIIHVHAPCQAREVGIYKPKSKSLREELQADIDKWLT